MFGLLVTDWNNYYQGDQQPEVHNLKLQGNLQPTNANFYIIYSLFSRLSAERGGAIWAQSKNFALIEASTFQSCTSQNARGALLLKNLQSIVLDRICASGCRVVSTTVGETSSFAYLSATDFNLYNIVSQSSITGCECYQGYTLDQTYLSPLESYLNVTYCKGDTAAAIYLEPSDNHIGRLQYSTLRYNTANGGHSIAFFYKNPASYEIQYSNIVNNQELVSGYGLMMSQGQTTVFHTCIQDNTCQWIFEIRSGLLKFQDCTIPVNQRTFYASGGTVDTSLIEPQYSFYNEYTYVINDLCHISPARTPARTPEMITMNYNTGLTDLFFFRFLY